MPDAVAAQTAAAERGVELELRSGDHFFDDAPISLLVDRWLCELSAHLGYQVEWQRFRPNFFARAAADFNALESELVGARLQVGTATLRVRSPIGRCVTITYHPAGEPSDPRILRFVAEQRDARMGVYCDVIKPGSVRVGDALTLL
jgi:uncharacterized protein